MTGFPDDIFDSRESAQYRVNVYGKFLAKEFESGDYGYGHLGASDSLFEVDEMEFIETK